MRVRGRLVVLDAPIVVHDMSRTGFGVVSERPFEPGQTLDFQLSAEDGHTFTVTAQAVHSRPMPSAPGLHLSGFMFVPGVLTGRVPQVLVDELIDAVSTNLLPQC